MHTPRRTEFCTTDPGHAHEMITTAYADNRLKVSGPTSDFRFEQSRIDLGEIRLDSYHTTLTTEYHLDPFGHVLIARVLDGVIDNRTEGFDRRLGRGDVYLPARHDTAQFTRLCGARVQLTAIDLALVAAVGGDGAAARLAQLSLCPLDPAAARRWQHSVDYLHRLVSWDPALLSPLVLGAAGRLLAAALLDTFAPEGDGAAMEARRDATPEALRRAVGFIEANVDLDIGIADIARASYVGVRALQLAFRRHLDTTPLGYLRRARMERVHADLIDSDPTTGATVTLVATRWGFTNPTRFAASYRATYGQTPGTTLRS